MILLLGRLPTPPGASPLLVGTCFCAPPPPLLDDTDSGAAANHGSAGVYQLSSINELKGSVISAGHKLQESTEQSDSVNISCDLEKAAQKLGGFENGRAQRNVASKKAAS